MATDATPAATDEMPYALVAPQAELSTSVTTVAQFDSSLHTTHPAQVVGSIQVALEGPASPNLQHPNDDVVILDHPHYMKVVEMYHQSRCTFEEARSELFTKIASFGCSDDKKNFVFNSYMAILRDKALFQEISQRFKSRKRSSRGRSSGKSQEESGEELGPEKRSRDEDDTDPPHSSDEEEVSVYNPPSPAHNNVRELSRPDRR